uniref:N-lysine methyltransferase smyd2 n=1 Tax=Sphaerodactylus townsendi TaxID=933632 RepID=A0ACB8GB31_9SAUR
MRSGDDSSELGLERFQSPGRGRGLRALRRFVVGELIFSCPAYTCVLTVNERGNHCECCFASAKASSSPVMALLSRVGGIL